MHGGYNFMDENADFWRLTLVTGGGNMNAWMEIRDIK